jgi:hypothetical protein
VRNLPLKTTLFQTEWKWVENSKSHPKEEAERQRKEAEALQDNEEETERARLYEQGAEELSIFVDGNLPRSAALKSMWNWVSGVAASG